MFIVGRGVWCQAGTGTSSQKAPTVLRPSTRLPYCMVWEEVETSPNLNFSMAMQLGADT